MSGLSESVVTELSILRWAYGRYVGFHKYLGLDLRFRYFTAPLPNTVKATGRKSVSMEADVSFNLAEDDRAFCVVHSSEGGIISVPDINYPRDNRNLLKVGESELKIAKERIEVVGEELPSLPVELMRIVLKAYDKKQIHFDTLASILSVVSTIANRDEENDCD